jgi:hypothetical protein
LLLHLGIDCQNMKILKCIHVIVHICRKFAYYKNDKLLKLVTSPMWRTSHWWQICYHNRTSYFIHPIFPHETSKFWFRLPTYNYETNLIRQFLIFSCKIQYIRLNFNNSTFEWVIITWYLEIAGLTLVTILWTVETERLFSSKTRLI